jgi:tetratricopeptide (TPR) repeat protein
MLLSCASTGSSDETTQNKSIYFINAENYLDKGNTYYQQFDYKRANEFFRDALNLYRSIDNSEGIIISCLNLSKTYLALGNLTLAEKYLTRAKNRLELSKDQTLNPLLIHIHIVGSSILIKRRDFSQANLLLALIADPVRYQSNEIKLAYIKNNVIIAIETKNTEAQQWIQKYENLMNELPADNAARKARLLRFKAAIHENHNKTKLYHDALTLYRELAHKPGIAATLEDWATFDYQKNNFKQSENKLKRALFIRISIQDTINTRKILILLQKIYLQQNSVNKANSTNFWLDKLSERKFKDWEALSREYNKFP